MLYWNMVIKCWNAKEENLIMSHFSTLFFNNDKWPCHSAAGYYGQRLISSEAEHDRSFKGLWDHSLLCHLTWAWCPYISKHYLCAPCKMCNLSPDICIVLSTLTVDHSNAGSVVHDIFPLIVVGQPNSKLNTSLHGQHHCCSSGKSHWATVLKCSVLK